MGYCVCSVYVVVDLIIFFFNYRNNLNCYGYEKSFVFDIWKWIFNNCDDRMYF